MILVNNGLTLQASLGYYINPLITILLAMLFFRERFGKVQWTSIGIASAGVLIFTFDVGTLPWGSLCVAVTFGFGDLSIHYADGTVFDGGFDFSRTDAAVALVLFCFYLGCLAAVHR